MAGKREGGMFLLLVLICVTYQFIPVWQHKYNQMHKRVVKLLALHCSFLVLMPVLMLVPMGVSYLYINLITSCKSSIKPPGGLVYFKPILGGGGLI